MALYTAGMYRVLLFSDLTDIIWNHACIMILGLHYERPTL